MDYNIKQIGKACTGCRTCEQICPQKCIVMRQNEEGFLYPQVNESQCIHCGLCLKKCAQRENTRLQETPKEFYAFRDLNPAELFHSASGGVSNAAARSVLLHGGVVFGAAYTADLEVQHIGITEDSERRRLQSSKYVQSDTGHCYTQARENLEAGKLVLFTGTPCQIDGFYHFLGKDYENLYTIDIICHGVPSPLLFKKYTAYMSEKMNERVIEYNFRSKEKRGWGTQYLAKTKTKTKTKTLSLDKYGKHFMDGDCYRECCYQCQYADVQKRPGNLTIGDFWGVNRTRPELQSEMGVSSLIVHNAKGQRLLEMMKADAEIVPLTLPEVLEKQGNLVRPTARPTARDTFYKGIQDEKFIDHLPVGLEPKERMKTLLPRKVIVMLKKYRGG